MRAPWLLLPLLLPILVPAALGFMATFWNRVPPLSALLRRARPDPALRFGVDTLAFRNDSRIHHRGKPDLFANWCFVMGRAVVQFQRFARFDPAAPRLAPAEYTALVRRITTRAPWRAPLPPHARIVVPGFSCLHELTSAEETAVKEGLPGRFWGIIRFSNWRLLYPHPSTHQTRVAAEIVAELQAGRPAQLFITDFPRIRLNHSVLAYAYSAEGDGDTVDFAVFDPNDPGRPGRVRFDRRIGRFRPAPLCGVDVPHFRAFRQYCSPLI
jgi:hypothetical protein